ncbi:hypothetical protein IW15_11910 [Chryseobacterium soli]|uniref:Uncharacterized protein n=1 Tax=Chryseobacterium soli TaxID=445961 RepID=A0A086A6E4_9FLAO|nr:hypothetical protein IW15_11910 [Chryseobacterium soli]
MYLKNAQKQYSNGNGLYPLHIDISYLFFILFPDKIIRIAPKNSTAQPHFSFTTPAKVSLQDLNGTKLKYSNDCILTANKVKANKRTSNMPKVLTTLALLFISPKAAHAERTQHVIAR